MNAESSWYFLVPWATVGPALRVYLVPLLAGTLWSSAAVFRFFSRPEGIKRQSRSVWWTLPFFLWALEVSVLNIQAFEVLVESYARALFVSIFIAAGEGTVSLCLLALVQLPGLLANSRGGAHPAAQRGAVGVVSAVAAVMLGYLLSISLAVQPLLATFGESAGAPE